MTAPLASDFNGQEGSLSLLVQCSSDHMVNAETFDYNLFNVAGNYGGTLTSLRLTIPRAPSTNDDSLVIEYAAGATTNTIVDSSFASTDFRLITVTWSKATGDGQLKYYRDGSLITTSSDIGTWPTTAYTTLEMTSGPASLSLAHVALWKAALPASDVTTIYAQASAPSKVGVTAELGATSAKVTFVNPTATTVYVTSLQIRGKRIKAYRPSTAEAIDYSTYDEYGELPLDIDMTYQDNPLVGQAAADFLLTNLENPITAIESISFLAERSAALESAFLDLEPGDRITLVEQQSDVSNDFFINGCSYRMYGPGIIEATWYVVPAQDSAYWALGVAGYSEIGATTIVSY